MKKFRLLLAIVLASVCSIQGMWAERTAPVFPTTAKTLVSGETYYLYNVGSDRFAYYQGTNAPVFRKDEAMGFVITRTDDGTYTIQYSSNNYYTWASGSNFNAQSGVDQDVYFRIEEVDDGYFIQRNRNYNENEYVGSSSNSNTSIYANVSSSGSILWQLYDEDGVAAILRYRAKKALYDALIASDDYAYAVEDYEAMYADDKATNDELQTAADKIIQSLLYKDMLTSGESEYPIYTELQGNLRWNYNTNPNRYSYTEVPPSAEGGLKATFEVDQDATLVYNYYLEHGTYFGLKVYLDGNLYQEINRYEAYNQSSLQRFFVEVPAGRHTVEWTVTNPDASTNGTRYIYLQDLAVYATPTITVNVSQAGGLGTEILYNVSHVKDVRKLIVTGNLNADDWTRINMMTSLFELNLSGTTVESLPTVKPGSFFHKLKLPAGLKNIEGSALSNTRLEEITFPSTLTSIGRYAFDGTRIKEAVIPESVNIIGEYNQEIKGETNVEIIPVIA